MNAKKILALLLAAATTASMSMTAFASSGGSEITADITGAIDGGVQSPKIMMEVPTLTNESVIFDIYNQLGTGQQIISSNMEFVNHSVVPVKVALKSYEIKTDQTDAIVEMDDPATIENADKGRNLLLWINEAQRDSNGVLEKDADGNYVFPEYVQATHSTKVFDTYFASGDSATPKAVTGYEFSKMARGAVASQNPTTGAIESTALDAAIVEGRSNTILRFDGMMNTQGDWKKDEAITITPVFEILPQRLTPEDIEAEGSGGGGSSSGQAITAGTAPAASTVTPMAGGNFPVNVTSGTLKASLTASDVTVTTSGSGAVSVKSVTIAGSTVTIKARITGAVATDVVTVKLNASAFTDESAAASNEVTFTLT